MLSCCSLFLPHSFTDPGSPPVNVSAEVVSSTSIAVRWEEVPPIDQNGIIITYELVFEPLETFSGVLMPEAINTTTMDLLLINLHPFVNYAISVRAHTNSGPGPYSYKIFVMTLEDCNLSVIELVYTGYPAAHCLYHMYLQILGVPQSISQLKLFPLSLL